MKELVTFIVKSIVEFPDQVVLEEGENEKGKVLRLQVADSDYGKVIGKQGRTAKSIRSILAAAAAKTGERYGFEIPDKENIG